MELVFSWKPQHVSYTTILTFARSARTRTQGMVFVQALRQHSTIQELSLWCLLTASCPSLSLLSKVWECKRGWQDSGSRQGHLQLTFCCWAGSCSSLNSDEFTPPRVGGHGKDKICLLTFASRIKVMLCAWKYTEAVNSVLESILCLVSRWQNLVLLVLCGFQPHDDALDLNLVIYGECGGDNFERSDHKWFSLNYMEEGAWTSK